MKKDSKQNIKVSCYVSDEELDLIEKYIKKLKYKPSLSEMLRASILSEVEGK